MEILPTPRRDRRVLCFGKDGPDSRLEDVPQNRPEGGRIIGAAARFERRRRIFATAARRPGIALRCETGQSGDDIHCVFCLENGQDAVKDPET